MQARVDKQGRCAVGTRASANYDCGLGTIAAICDEACFAPLSWGIAILLSKSRYCSVLDETYPWVRVFVIAKVLESMRD